MPKRELRRRAWPLLATCVALLALALAGPAPARSEGSGTVFPADTPSRFRANLEWRTAAYGSADSPRFNLLRRTLLKLYAEAGETILVGSSGVGTAGAPSLGDIRIFTPGAVTGEIGRETIPALGGAPAEPQPGAFANGFSCLAQRATAGNADRGRIDSRAQELAGPQTELGLPAAGYRPCLYRAPVSGIYDVVFTGPEGDGSNVEGRMSGAVEPTADDFGLRQRTSVTAWDVTVREDPSAEAAETGRLFLYYFAGITGGGGREVIGEGFVVTRYGFVYRVRYAADPFGFILFSNQHGFQDSDGSPLYHNLMADPRAPTQDQNELRELLGGVELLPPEYPIFFAPPYGPALDALGIPRIPEIPEIAGFAFTGSDGGITSDVGEGGTLSFTVNQPGTYAVVISADNVDFSPRGEGNRLLRGIAEEPGLVEVPWDGKDNDGVDFPQGSYSARMFVKGGEAHFPFLDVENNVTGGPRVELTNPPDRDGDGQGDCPPWEGGCFGAFYDDGGYVTANGTLVGEEAEGPLCPGDADNPLGFGRPPAVLVADLERGYDTRTNQRAYGFPVDANPAAVCMPDGGFGDKKGLDLWTFYPSNVLTTPIRIRGALAITLVSFTAAPRPDGVDLRWETGVEVDTAGFHLLRSDSGERADARRVTASLIPARGSAGAGAVYRWADPTPAGARTAYWLEEVEQDGDRSEHGPARPASGLGELIPQLYLPLLR